MHAQKDKIFILITNLNIEGKRTLSLLMVVVITNQA
jgi:hypothetical protein